MSQEQDQEKLLNAAAQVANNALSASMNIASLKKPKTTIEVKTAKDDLRQARQLLQAGTNLEKIKQTISQSPVAQEIKQRGGDVLKYVVPIVRKAQIEHEIQNQPEKNQQVKRVKKQEKTYKRGR